MEQCIKLIGQDIFPEGIRLDDLEAHGVPSTLEYDAIVIPYNQEWENGTGYYDGAVYEELPVVQSDLQVKIYCSKSPAPNNRRIFIIPFKKGGNIVLFERYTPGTGSPFVWVANTPRWARGLCPSAVPVSIASMLLYGEVNKLLDRYDATKEE